MSILENKIDFIVLAAVKDANPNGDPLNGNRPRSTYDGFGEISDVCIKRKSVATMDLPVLVTGLRKACQKNSLRMNLHRKLVKHGTMLELLDKFSHSKVRDQKKVFL